jgi:hypothetical protein
MGITQDKNLEALTREFEESRARVWVDERIPLEQKQAEVDRLWREFDDQRRALTEGIFRAGASVEAGETPVSPSTGRPSLIPRQRRKYWK